MNYEGKSNSKKLVVYAMIAAIYATASLALAPISFGGVQFRISEALTLLPVIMPEAIIGVTLGCAITNLAGAMLGINILGFLDVFVGTAATFLAAILTYQLRNIRFGKLPLLAVVPPIALNALFIGAELTIALTTVYEWTFFWSMFVSVGAGQFLACVILGIPLVMQMEKYLRRQKAPL